MFHLHRTRNCFLKKMILVLICVASGGSKFSGVETQASFLPAKHVGLIAAYSSGKNDDGGGTYMRFHKFEGGVGYVTNLSKGWHFETYGGIGTGRSITFMPREILK